MFAENCEVLASAAHVCWAVGTQHRGKGTKKLGFGAASTAPPEWHAVLERLDLMARAVPARGGGGGGGRVEHLRKC